MGRDKPSQKKVELRRELSDTTGKVGGVDRSDSPIDRQGWAWMTQGWPPQLDSLVSHTQPARHTPTYTHVAGRGQGREEAALQGEEDEGPDQAEALSPPLSRGRPTDRVHGTRTGMDVPSHPPASPGSCLVVLGCETVRAPITIHSANAVP